MPAPAKREAYAADITYGTNNEYGFDYLRDNMAFSPEERVPVSYTHLDVYKRQTSGRYELLAVGSTNSGTGGLICRRLL